MLDLLGEGYTLVSVTAGRSGSSNYFLSKSGMIAKCEEHATFIAPPPPLSAQRGQPPTFDPDNFVPEIKSNIECAELSPLKGNLTPDRHSCGSRNRTPR